MRARAAKAAPSAPDVFYPTGDGEPMAEHDTHRKVMQHDAIDVLDDWFAGAADVYVTGNNFLYYEEGEPSRRVSPDCYVVRGVPKRDRLFFKTWEERARPCFVLEVTSKSTRLVDLGEKMAKYRDDLGVAEYFLFDPTGEWIEERLRGFRLEGAVYVPIERDARGRLASRALGLEVGLEPGPRGRVRFWRPGDAAPLPNREERAQRARAETEHARAETEHARAETEHARAETEHARAETEHARAETEHARAAARSAEARARAAEAEARRLVAELAKARPRAGRKKRR